MGTCLGKGAMAVIGRRAGFSAKTWSTPQMIPTSMAIFFWANMLRTSPGPAWTAPGGTTPCFVYSSLQNFRVSIALG